MNQKRNRVYHRLVWNNGVTEIMYRVEADTIEDAKCKLSLYLMDEIDDDGIEEVKE